MPERFTVWVAASSRMVMSAIAVISGVGMTVIVKAFSVKSPPPSVILTRIERVSPASKSREAAVLNMLPSIHAPAHDLPQLSVRKLSWPRLAGAARVFVVTALFLDERMRKTYVLIIRMHRETHILFRQRRL
jgi:hypothetical protein